MSAEIKHCFEDDDIADLAQKMADERIRRLPVFNDDKRLVGIVSLADLATSGDRISAEILVKALSGICQGQRRRAPQMAEMPAAK
jgi:CBS-domain-containing membrane protein